MSQARTEFAIQALLIERGEDDAHATWEHWMGPVGEGSLLRTRLAWLAERKAHAHSGRPQAEVRVLDYRLLRRTVVTTDWECDELAYRQEDANQADPPLADPDLFPDPRTTTEVPF
jgi:hypothetical protein